MPLISIIIPVYNAEKYLRQCVDSILAQSFDDFELILVDDGSPDGCGSICDEYALHDSRVRAFHTENAGVCSARNAGMNRAVGEWITFVDADDLVLPGYLSTLADSVMGDDGLEYVQGGYSTLCGGNITPIKSYACIRGDDSVFLYENVEGMVCSKLFRRDIIIDHSLLFDLRMKICEDMAFTIDYLAFCRRYCFVEGSGYVYRIDNVHSATQSARFNDYELEKCSHIHLRNSILKAIETNDLQKGHFYNVFGARLSCMRMVYSMYRQRMPRDRRLEHLHKDLTPEDLDILSYVDYQGRVHKFLANLLNKRHFVLFDFIMSLLYVVAW